MASKEALQDAVKRIDEVKKSLDVEKKKTPSDLKAQEEATKSEDTDTAEKHVKDLKLSDDNEKATKKADAEKADDDAEKCGDGNDVEASAKKAKKSTTDEKPKEDPRSKAEKDEDDDGSVTDSATKNTDGKVEADKAKQAKDLHDVDDPKGHEQASKSYDAALDALSKAVDTMAEMQKSYIQLANDSMAIAKSLVPAEDNVEKSTKKSDTEEKCGDGNSVDLSAKKSAKKSDTEKCDDDAEKCGDGDDVEASAKKAKKSAKEEKCESPEEGKQKVDVDGKSASVKKDEDTDDGIDESAKKAKKSMPASKAVSPAAVAVDEKSAEEDKAEKSVLHASDFRDVIAKSISNFDGAQDPDSVRSTRALKSLYGKVRDLNDDAPIKDNLVKEFNEI